MEEKVIESDLSPSEIAHYEHIKALLLPNSPKYKILYRKDDVNVRPNVLDFSFFNGCIFIVEEVGSPMHSGDNDVKRRLFLVWAPNTFLSEINGRPETHENPKLNLPKTVEKQAAPSQETHIVAPQQQVYVSAQISPSQQVAKNQKPKKKQQTINQFSYAIAISFHDLSYIKRIIPNMGYSYMIVMQKNGTSHPPLYFHNGGIQEFFKKLQSLVTLTKDKDDGNVFRVVDICEPLQKSLNEFEFQEYYDDMFQGSRNWQILEWGSRIMKPVTNAFYSKRADSLPSKEIPKQADTIVSHKVYGKMNINPNYLGNSSSLSIEPSQQEQQNEQKLMDQQDNEQVLVVAPPTVITTPLMQPIMVQPPPQLLSQNHVPISEPEPTPTIDDSNEFEVIDRNHIPLRSVLQLNGNEWDIPPLDEQSWSSFFDVEGRITDVPLLKKHIFYGGVNDNIRCHVWKYLTGYYDYGSTRVEREKLDEAKRNEYFMYKQQWTSITQKQESRFALFKEKKHRVEKDVVRTDRNHPLFQAEDSPNLLKLNDILLTYAFYNFDLGYCQGMGDLLSPILSVIPDEIEAFWAFASLMERMEGNFQIDSVPMRTQLLQLNNLTKGMDSELYEYLDNHEATNFFFCFRWILIIFKREFPFEDVKRLWESIWSEHRGGQFHLFMCYALLHKHKRNIIDKRLAFDEILKYCVDLSMKMEALEVLKISDEAFKQYEKTEKWRK